MLSDRRQRVLAALIEEYVSHALPVGSRTLVENYRLGVSSATVRNELSALEEEGYISQPHTSAGRVPTDFGYRSFVDDLLAGDLAREDEDERVAQAARQMRETATELDDLMERTTAALARFTDCLSIVVPAPTRSTRVRQVSVVSLSPHRVLVIVVGDDGQVANRHLESPLPISPDETANAQHVLNALFGGRTLHEAHDAAEAYGTALADPFVRMLASEVVSCLRDGDAGHAHRLGLSTLLRKPEFQQPQALVPVLEVLEDDTVLLKMLQNPQGEAGTIVRIGRENQSEQLSGVSVVASPFGAGDGAGVVAVIGPTRMNYAQVIRAVRAACATLSGDWHPEQDEES